MGRDDAATVTLPLHAQEAARDGDARALEPRRRAGLAEALWRPRGIALIGSGLDVDETKSRPLQLLRRHKFRGEVYPINVGRRPIHGVQAWSDLVSLPGPVDVAYILAEGEVACDALAACGRAAVPLAMIRSPISDEHGDGVRARLDRVVAEVRAQDVRVIGPGSPGIVVPQAGLALTDETAFASRGLVPGRFMLLAESGSAMGAVFSRGTARGLGFGALVSVGSELDLSLGEIGALAVSDSEVDAFLLFLGTIRHPASLARFAARAHAAGKPILAYRLPRVGEDASDERARGDAADAFLTAHGIIRVEQFDTLVELAPMTVRRRPPRGRSAAIVSAAGCCGAMVADRLGRGGSIAVEGLDDLARERLARQGVALGGGRIAEIAAEGEALRALLDETLDAPNNDVVVAALGSGAETDPAAAVAPLLAAAQRSDKPLAALVMPEAPEALRLLSGAGIAAFRTPEAAADGLRAFLNWAPPAAPVPLLDDEGPCTAHHVFHAGQAMQIFRLLGVTIPTMLWLRRDTRVPRSLPFPPPYVARILSPDIAHPRELGGLALGIETVSALGFAVENMLVNVSMAAPDAYLDGVAIQRVERGLAEVSIRFERDPEAGPLVTLAMGEGKADIYGDRTVRLAPLDRTQAYAMIDSVKGLACIRGCRGSARGDLDALAQALVAISSFALISAPRVFEAVIDPLLIRAEGRGTVALNGWMRTQ